MSGYPPPPPNQNRFQPPPGAGSGFAPPPNVGSGFAPPPGMGTGFAPPPPGGGDPPRQQPGSGFAPPPPPINNQQSGNVQQLNQGISHMSMQSPPPGGAFHAPPPPGQSQPSPPAAAGHGFLPPPAPGQGFRAPTPPGPGRPLAPGMFQPPAPGSSQQPPPAPGQPLGAASSSFYQPQPAPGQIDRMGQPAPAAGVPPGSAAPSNAPMFNENIDFSVKIPDNLVRFTCNKVAQTAQLASSTKIPYGAIMRPLAPQREGEEIETIQPGSAGIIRCKRCRTYINAFVSWSEHGRRWRCNICAQINDCPAAYFCHLDDQGLRRDRYERPELSRSVVEFIAPAEYMVRPPQEPSYFFVIDVSATAIRSGMVHSAAKAIKESLDDLPGRGRTKIGFITFDNAVHYYNLSSELSSPQMMVVADLKELFVPLPENLLVNLQESRKMVEAFLDSLPEIFAKNPVVSQSCLGPALKAGFTVMKTIGGKLCVFQSIMPNLGDGALKQRENRALMGTPNEVKLLRPENSWYKDTAVEFSRQQISVDMFLFPYQYMDLAALSELPRYTAGSIHSYVSFNHQKDGPRFEQQLYKVLTQETAFEAVMRVRCTKGMRISNFYGNFYIRGTDLMALPNCNSDSVFGFDLAHDEQNIAGNYVTLQAALLYTSSEGQRRIRVMTQVLPVSNLSSELMASVDVDSVCNLLSKQAVEVAIKTSLDNARMRLQQTCVDMIRMVKGGDKRTVSGYTVPPPPGQQGGQESDEKQIPENLQLLPLNTLALMKNVAFRGGTDIHPDERIQAHRLLGTMFVQQSKRFIYPRLFPLHEMDENCGYSVEDLPQGADSDMLVEGRNRILLPDPVGLSIEHLSSEGVYLLDNGVEMYVWVGRAADISILGALFGVQSLDDIDVSQVQLLTSGDPFASRVGAIIDALRDDDDDYHVIPKIHIVREGDQQMESRFFWFLVEDRASFQGGTYNYADFMHFVNNPGTPGPGQPPAAGGPPGPHGAAPPPGGPRSMPPPPGHRGVAPPGGGYGGPPGPPPQQQVGGYRAPPGPPQQSQSHGYGAPPGPPPLQGGPPSYGGSSSYSGPPTGQSRSSPAPHGGSQQGYGGPPAGPHAYGPPQSGTLPGPPSRASPAPGGTPGYGAPPPGPPQLQGPPSSGDYHGGPPSSGGYEGGAPSSAGYQGGPPSSGGHQGGPPPISSSYQAGPPPHQQQSYSPPPQRPSTNTPPPPGRAVAQSPFPAPPASAPSAGAPPPPPPPGRSQAPPPPPPPGRVQPPLPPPPAYR